MDTDLELWTKWKKTKSVMDLENLLRQMNPLIQAEVNRWAGTLARATLESQAKKLAVKAFSSFDPGREVKLSTHVTNQLQKLSRVNYANQNAARIPEYAAMQYHTVRIAKDDFMADQGREPSYAELADILRWSPKRVEQFETQFGRKELLESIDTPGGTFVPHTHDPVVTYAYHEMSPRQQQIWDAIQGTHGPRLSNTEIMKKLGISQGVLSYEKSKMKKLLREVS